MLRRVDGGRIVAKDVPMLNALNEVLRDDYIEDCQRGVLRWNKVHREGRHRLRADAAAHGLQPPDRRLRRAARRRPTAAS